MRIENVPNPGTFSGAQALRVAVARAISFCEVTASLASDGKASVAGNLEEMFTFAANAVSGLVRPPALVGLQVAPASVSVAEAATQALVVTAEYEDGSTAVVTDDATYVSAAPATATVSAAGVVTGVAAGTTTVTVTFETEELEVPVEVTA